MNDHSLLPDDPRITAFALGELEGEDRVAVERALRRDPALRATVEQIRQTAAQIEAALADELTLPAEADASDGKVVAFPLEATAPVAVPDATPASASQPVPATAAAILPGNDPVLLDGGAYRNVYRYPRLYYVVGGLVAACFALIAIIQPPHEPKPKAAVVAKAVPPEKTLIDMNELMKGVDVAAAPLAAPVEEAVTITPPEPKLPLPLLDQAKENEKPALVRTLTPVAPVVDPLPAAPVDLSAATKTTSGLAANDRGMIVNESRGMPGATVRELTGGIDFDKVAPKGGLQPQPPSEPLMFLPPFSMSVERVRARAAAAAIANGKPVVPANVLPDAKPFEPEEAPAALLATRATPGTGSTEVYGLTADNGFLSPKQNPFSLFAATTDTASYANVRRLILNRQRPPREAVRIEEMLNSFTYRYPAPGPKADAPFAATLEVTEAPWAPAHRLVRIGVKGREVATAERPAANLVFLLDVSGSMNAPTRLPLVKESMRMLLTKLRADDRVAIVTYAGQSGVALPSTPVAESPAILAALEKLSTGGATNGGLGIQLAYDIAKENRVEGGLNRVILCTDGDFNVGTTGSEELASLVEDRAKSGLSLTVLGYGMGNLKDATLEQLARRGNGHYGYIDSRREAERLLVQQVNGALVPIAKDVKIRVEFNPSQVASYRLIGYENRLLKKDEFADDKVEAGEVGAGHTVTALYEIVPVGVTAPVVAKEPELEERRYNFYSGVADNSPLPGRIDPYGKEMLTVKVRYKKPDGLLSRAVDFPLTDAGGRFAEASPDFKFAAAVAGFGMILRESPHRGTTTLANVIEWAEAGAAEDPTGQRTEFIELAKHTEHLEK